MAIEWIGEQTSGGVSERSFRVARTVPGVLWRPVGVERPSAVLLGHGGGSDKRSPRMVEMAHWLASRGLASLAIDGPYHGDRPGAPMAPEAYQARLVAEGMESVLDRMVHDWLAAVDAVSSLVDTDSLAYHGLSMGTRFGLPTVVALGDRVRCAVLGKFGAVQGADLNPGMSTPERVRRDAERIAVPTLFHVPWDDELFPRSGQLDLFDTLGSADKRLIAYPGGHGVTLPEAVDLWRAFLVERLTAR
jgi:dienelactone hydrolase